MGWDPHAQPSRRELCSGAHPVRDPVSSSAASQPPATLPSRPLVSPSPLLPLISLFTQRVASGLISSVRMKNISLVRNLDGEQSATFLLLAFFSSPLFSRLSLSLHSPRSLPLFMVPLLFTFPLLLPSSSCCFLILPQTMRTLRPSYAARRR